MSVSKFKWDVAIAVVVYTEKPTLYREFSIFHSLASTKHFGMPH